MNTLLTERNRNIVSGAVGLLLLVALTTIGIKASFGAYEGGYEIHGTFAAAGQGLLEGSDVKIRGVTIGEVEEIRLVENRARITLRIEPGVPVPADAQAVIRPKTLFGEKFVDILRAGDRVDVELAGPFLSDGDEIEDTLGGFELEQVLTDTYPILEAIDPAELAVVFDELANAGDGLGENINRSIVNGATLSELAVANDAEFRQFTSDLALLSEELERLSPDLVSAARDLNVALPSLNDRADRINAALVELGRLSGDLADIFENNESFTTNALTNGSKTLQILFDRRDQVQPLLLGLTQYTQTIAEAIRFEVGDGTMMAAVKNLVVVGEGHEEPPDDGGGGDGGSPLPLPVPTVPPLPTTLPDLPLDPGLSDQSGDDLLDLLTGGDRG